MRCLTLGGGLVAVGQETWLLATMGIGWLADQVTAQGIGHVDAMLTGLTSVTPHRAATTRIVVDSYRMSAAAINVLNARVLVLARAGLDHDLEADTATRAPAVAGR